jgi:hypothetical protein
MSAEYVQILYVGNALAATSLQSCVEPLDWLVYAPKTEREALGMYIGYMPHITILDAQRSIDKTSQKNLVKSVYHHLRTVDAAPIIIVGNRKDWPDIEGVYVIPPFTALSKLVMLVQELVERHPRSF